MTDVAALPENPLDAGPKPPFPKQHQDAPGVESAMQPRPDHGEHTYTGQSMLAREAAPLFVLLASDDGALSPMRCS